MGANLSALSQSTWRGAVMGAVLGLSGPAWPQALPPHASGTVETLTTYPPVDVLAATVPYRQFNNIEITGSSIIRKEQTQTLPVLVITRSDILNSGAADLAEVVQKHSTMLENINPSHLGLVSGGYDSAGLHGFQKQTLVLLNGTRLAPYGRPTVTGSERSGVDLRLVPLSAVDRIEILTDGASSIYGTDAIAGVINIITVKERTGFEINALARVPDGQKGQGQSLALSWGSGNLQRDGYSLFVSADHEQQKQLFGKDRAYASAGRYELQRNGQTYWAYGPALTAYQSGNAMLYSGGKYRSANYSNGACSGDGVPMWGQNACYYNNYANAGLYPETRISRFYSQGEKLIDAGTTVFFEVGYRSIEENRANRLWPSSALALSGSPNAVGSDLATQYGFDPAKTSLYWRPTELGLLMQGYGQREQRAKIGVKGEWQTWNYNASFDYSDNLSTFKAERVQLYPSTLLKDANGKLQNSAALVPLGSDSAQSQSLQDQLLALRSFDTLEQGSVAFTSLNMRASGSIMEVNGKDVLLGLGGSWRQEKNTFTGLHTAQYQAAPDYSAKRNVAAVFTELQVPVRPDVDFLASLRHDQYSDVGGTTNGKISARWTINPQWSVRGSTGTGFRAPSVAQTQNVSAPYINGALNAGCTAAVQQVIAILQQQGYSAAQCDPAGVVYLGSVGNPDLKPETSRQDNVGMRYNWSRNHTLALDWWRVRINNAFLPYPTAAILADPLAHLNYIYYDPQQGVSLYNRLVNFGYQAKTGLDMQWQYRQPTELGVVNLNFNGTYLLQSEQLITPGGVPQTALKTSPRYQAQLNLGWNPGNNWYGQVTLRSIGSYMDGTVSTAINASTGKVETLEAAKIPAFNTVDLAVRYQPSPKVSYFTRVENVFNRQAPMVLGSYTSAMYGTNGTYANWWGRTVSLGVKVGF